MQEDNPSIQIKYKLTLTPYKTYYVKVNTFYCILQPIGNCFYRESDKQMLNQNLTPLFDAVKKYIDEDIIPFHVPGHKHGKGICQLTDFLGKSALNMDVNGMNDLDYYNSPTGVIQEAQDLLADAFGAKHAFFLVNGTTGGIQAMIMGVCKPGDKIIVPRNVHRSIINGMILGGVTPVYIQPEIDKKLGMAHGVTAVEVKKAILSNPEAKAVLLINPTYYGVSSDLETIINMTHEYNMLALVDEAHGAHMYFHEDFPPTAIESGADMCAISMHKTGGSLTQSSVLMIGSNRISPESIREALNLLSTSSASYLLMCSLDIARKQLAVHGRKLLSRTLCLAKWARDEINKINGFYAFGREMIGKYGCFGFDETKLGINVRSLGYTGYEMETKLRKEYNIQIEMADLNNVLAVVSIGDRKKDLSILINSLKDIADKSKIKTYNKMGFLPEYPKNIICPRDAYYMNKKLIRLKDSANQLSGETIMAYPPGIPIICAGELITNEIVEYLTILKSEECHLQGMTDPSLDYIKIIVETK